MTWLLDTNVLSELRKPRPEQKVTAYIAQRPIRQLYISSVTLAELRYGIDILPDPQSRADFNLWLTGTVRPMFAGRVLEITEHVMLRWRFLVADGRKIGRTFSQPDLIIAATALEHGKTLVTRNVRDFTGLNLTISNPWDGDKP